MPAHSRQKAAPVTQPVKVDIWSDIACPFCYTGAVKFAEGAEAAGIPVQVEYRSFQLSPHAPEHTDLSHAEHLAQHLNLSPEQGEAMTRRTEQMVAAVGLSVDTAAIVNTNTHRAHELLHYAKAHGVQADVKARLMRGHFAEGLNAASIPELADVAAAAGLDRDDAVRALESGRYAADVEFDKRQAQAFGIQGVPFFVFDSQYGVSGAQEPDTFADVLAKVLESREADPDAAGEPADGGELADEAVAPKAS